MVDPSRQVTWADCRIHFAGSVCFISLFSLLEASFEISCRSGYFFSETQIPCVNFPRFVIVNKSDGATLQTSRSRTSRQQVKNEKTFFFLKVFA